MTHRHTCIECARAYMTRILDTPEQEQRVCALARASLRYFAPCAGLVASSPPRGSMWRCSLARWAQPWVHDSCTRTHMRIHIRTNNQGTHTYACAGMLRLSHRYAHAHTYMHGYKFNTYICARAYTHTRMRRNAQACTFIRARARAYIHTQASIHV